MSDVFTAILADPIGRWFLYVGVTLFFVILAAFVFLSVRKRLQQIAADLGLVKHEVKNNHTTNLREESDERHEENSVTLGAILVGMQSLTGSVEGLQRGQSELYQLIKGHTSSIAELEHTLDKRPEIVLDAEALDPDENGTP